MRRRVEIPFVSLAGLSDEKLALYRHIMAELMARRDLLCYVAFDGSGTVYEWNEPESDRHPELERATITGT